MTFHYVFILYIFKLFYLIDLICNCIAGLNEELVQLLLMRDELHMEQDAMLVDVEDLTRLGLYPNQNTD